MTDTNDWGDVAVQEGPPQNEWGDPVDVGKGQRLRQELAAARHELNPLTEWLSADKPLLSIRAPSPSEAAAFASPIGMPRLVRPYTPSPTLEPVREAVRGGTESLAETTQGVTQPSNLPLLPLTLFPPARAAMGLYFGAQAAGTGAGQIVGGLETGQPREVGAGAANLGLGSTLLRGGLNERLTPPPLKVSPNIPDVGPVSALERSPVPFEQDEAHAANVERAVTEGAQPVPPVVLARAAPVARGGIPANAEMLDVLPKPTVEELAINELTRAAGDEMKGLVEAEGEAVRRTGEALPKPTEVGAIPMATLPVREPSGLQLTGAQAVAEAKGGLPTAEGTLELLPKAKVDEPAINELLRAEGDEMKRLVAEEGARVARTGEALPQPTGVKEPVPIGQLGIPAVPKSSGLKMAFDALPETAKGGVKAVADMLDHLPEGELKEVAMNELTRQGVERGEALRRVEALGDAVRRVRDFSKAKSQAVGADVTAQIAEGIAQEVHPEKPLTANQVKITFDALKKALADNRLSEDRPGIVSGSGLEAWADRVIAEGRGRVSVGLDPVQLAAYIVKGVALLERGLTSLAEWTAAMVKEYGPAIRPYLKNIRAQSETARAALLKAGQTAMQNAGKPEAETARLENEAFAAANTSEGKRKYTPAIRKGGVVTAGASHEAIPGKGGERGYVDSNGNFLTLLDVARAEMEKPAPPAKPAVTETAGRVDAPLKMASTPATGATDIAPSPAGPARGVWGTLQSLRARAQFTFKGGANKRDVAGWADAIENKAKLYARQQANEVRDQLASALSKPVAKLTPTEQTALTFVIEAGGDANKLAADLDALREAAKRPDAPNAPALKQAISAVEEALSKLDRYTPVAKRFNNITESQLIQENASGISTLKRSRYVPHIQDVSDDFATLFESGGGSGAGGFKHARTYPDFVSSLVAGIKPKTLNAVDALAVRLEAGQRQINTRTWIAQLRDVVDPSSGRSLVTDMQRVSRGPGLPDDVVAPQGYTPMFLGRQQVAVLSGYSKFLRVLTGDSLVGDRPLGAALLKGVTTFKHVALAFDLFHLANITRLGASLGTLRYGRGLWLTDYAPETLTAMMKRGEIPAEVLPQLLEDKRIIEQGVKAGFNVGQLQQALYTDWVRKVPGLGDFNRFLFEKYQRGIMSKAFVIEFQRAKAATPELSDTTVAKNVARDLNTRFANLNRQSWIKSKTFQDLLRVAFLAPQWNEGLLRSELGGVRQAGVAVREAGLRQRVVVGSLARSAGTLFLAQLVGNQILNYITSGRPTWHNPEGNKLDAYVPDVMGQSNGFYISPYAMDAELTHQLASQVEKDKGNVLAAARDVLAFKLSGFGRAAKTFWTQTDWRGKRLTGWQTAYQMGVDVAPGPIGVPAIGRAIYSKATGKPITEQYPGATQKSLLQTGGFKAERAHAAP